ncbi:hypothetical protein [Luteimonas salinilitoris]|uniref:DUF4168 domain-containing protein n=1 Tax=Luteimonas salinilitoris TaxID=3237697 RepID=A0ABV4HMX3_9GAMM
MTTPTLPSAIRIAASVTLACAMAACNPVDDEAKAAPEAIDESATSSEAAPAEPAGTEGAPAPAAMIDSHAKLAGFGGSVQAVAEACGGSSADELAAAKRQQKALFIQGGGNEAAFEAAFEAGYDKTRTEMANATPAERAKGCAEIREMSEAAAAMPTS